MLYEYLKANYILGEPIFVSDISISEMTEEGICYQLKQLTDEGILCRFDSEVYYFPKTSVWGEKISLSADTVAVHKYIVRRGKRVGYYSGYTLANRMGLSTQVPLIEEITSNYATVSICEVMIKNRKFVVRQPVVEITQENVKVLQFLDCINNMDKCAEEELEICRMILSKYAKEYGITKEMVDKYIINYPEKVSKAVCKMGIEYTKSPNTRPVNVAELTEDELSAELEKGYADMVEGKNMSARKEFEDIRKDYNIKFVK